MTRHEFLALVVASPLAVLFGRRELDYYDHVYEIKLENGSVMAYDPYRATLPEWQSQTDVHNIHMLSRNDKELNVALRAWNIKYHGRPYTIDQTTANDNLNIILNDLLQGRLNES